MSETLYTLSFAALMERVLGEWERERSIFGVREAAFVRPSGAARFERYGVAIDTPVGPAAGPHTQLAGNIVAAFLAGARCIELKTVQTLDGAELAACVARPCINATDECYNVEWSTELTVEQAQAEYIKAWVAVHVLAVELALGPQSKNSPSRYPGLDPQSDNSQPQVASQALDSVSRQTNGSYVCPNPAAHQSSPCCVAFNMSVGYSLEGVQSPKIDSFLEGLRNASGTGAWLECISWLEANLSRFERFDAAALAALPTQVSSSVTLSTLHGCPREEIERIAHYLLVNKGFHTSIKCNPTLLGYDQARRILNEHGYGYLQFDEHHFVEDLQFDDAVAMLARLQAVADERGLDFGVKITNTFPVAIAHGELPGEEMYMSGRALFPLSFAVAKRLTETFDGGLAISYSGGADAFTLPALLAAGLRPVTVATTLLKPGGYERLAQLALLSEQLTAGLGGAAGGASPGTNLPSRCPELGPHSYDEQLKTASQAPGDAFAEGAHPLGPPSQPAPVLRLTKEYRGGVGSRKSSAPLPLSNCAMAPCSETGCPINQQIPAYLERVATGKLAEAFEIIVSDNVLPSMTGTLCDHQCQNNCTRLDYDDPLQIRSAKKAAVVAAQATYLQTLAPPPLRTRARVLVIGAGPAGLAAASYLRRAGVDVTVHEQRECAGGVVAHVIPEFRITAQEVALDVQLAKKLGVRFEFGAAPSFDLAALRTTYDYVILATGAWREGTGTLTANRETIFDALAFLEQAKVANEGTLGALGARVAVIGGGDVAMDCARAALRVTGVEEVSLVYRRTLNEMPAQREEREEALTEGVILRELLSPLSFARGELCCEVMTLGAQDSSGRRSATATGKRVTLPFDAVINAVGAGVDTAPFVAAGIALDERGLPLLSAAGESSVADVYLVGDCATGPQTIVRAMAAAKCAAKNILSKLGLKMGLETFALEACRTQLLARKGTLEAASPEPMADVRRCLGCNSVCEVCVDVCPNRANVAIVVEGTAQILHLDALCNECGNCATFCPTSGKPYKDKPTLSAEGVLWAPDGASLQTIAEMNAVLTADYPWLLRR